MIGWQAKAIGAGVIVALGLLVKLYIGHLHGEIDELKADNIALEASRDSAVAMANMEREAREDAAQRASQATAERDRALLQRDEALRVFTKHNLDHLLQEKPGLIEKRAREATADVWETIRTEAKRD